jgi:hypothetical protein
MSDAPSYEVHALFAWAERAAKLRFGPTKCSYRGEAFESEGRCAIFLDNGKLLGAGKTWPEAMTEAVKRNTDIPQPPIELGPQPSRWGEEHIEEFCRAMRSRDVFTEFLLWYGAQRDALPDPEGWPRTRSRSDWLENFIWFIKEGGVK